MGNKMPVLYSADWCTNCGPMKQFLTQVGFEYEVVNIDELDETPKGLRSIPTLEVDGEFYVGDKIKEYVGGL
jgi:glutaredoxin